MGKAFKRRLNNGFPYYRLRHFIEYRARLLGIKVIKISENYTSRHAMDEGIRSFESEATLNAQTADSYAMRAMMGP